VDLEWLILADGAHIAEGKLYLLGGGWDILAVNTDFPVQKHLAVAASFRVPWNETNQRHEIEIEIADADANSLAKVGGQIEVGRPVGIPLGFTQRYQFSIDASLQFEKAGTYVIVARIEGTEAGRVPFHVIRTPSATSPPLNKGPK
jgi:hypothetical protein